MIIPIRCFTCGKVVANVYDYYVEESAKLATAAATSQSKDKETTVKHFDTVHTGPILDKLGLTRYCCRRQLLSQVDMMDTI